MAAEQLSQSGVPSEPVIATKSISSAMLFALSLLAGLAAFSIDLYLPAFPAMAEELSTSATGIQLSLTAFLIGAGAGQLVFGPWSDRAGRMTPLLTGLALFLAASVATVFATSAEMLMIARLLQGLGGAGGMVIGRAIILDRATGKAAARALSLMMLIGGVAPVIGPVVGGVLAEPIGWRGLLAVVAGLGLAALGATLLFVRESLPRAEREARKGTAQSGIGKALRSRAYLGHVAAFAFGMAIMMAYISASPFVYQTMIGLSPMGYGIAFAANAVGMMVATTLSARLVARFSVRALTAAGLAISLVAILVLLAFSFADAPAGWLIAPLFFAIAPLGLVFGNATALALSAVPHAATGTASALLGLLQFALAGIVAGLVGISGEHTALPLALTMLASALAAILGLVVAGSNSAEHAIEHHQEPLEQPTRG